MDNGDLYQVRVAATNSNGTGGWSTSGNATPTPVVPAKPNPPQFEIADASLVVTWSVGDGAGLAVTGYEIQWRDPATQTDWGSLPASQTVSVTGTSHTISGLTNGTSYQVRLAATNNEGTGPWSDRASGTPATSSGQPKNLQLTGGRHAYLPVSWDQPDNSQTLGIDSYLVEWRTTEESFTSSRQHSLTDLQTLSYTIENLKNDVSYVVRVTSRSGGNTIASSVGTAATLSAANYIESEIVERYEDAFPWLRQALDKVPLIISVATLDEQANYVAYIETYGDWCCSYRGRQWLFTDTFYRSRHVVSHELAHHYTLDHRVPERPDLVAIGWLYIDHRISSRCSVSVLEVYPDAIAYVTMGNWNSSYLTRCQAIAPGTVLDQEARTVIGSILRGDTPSWFEEYYAAAVVGLTWMLSGITSDAVNNLGL